MLITALREGLGPQIEALTPDPLAHADHLDHLLLLRQATTSIIEMVERRPDLVPVLQQQSDPAECDWQYFQSRKLAYLDRRVGWVWTRRGKLASELATEFGEVSL